MKKYFILTLILSFSLGLGFSQGMHKNTQNKNAIKVMPKVMQEFQTKVLAVEYAMPKMVKNAKNGMNLNVKIKVLNKFENKEVTVRLAPQNYLLANNFSLKQGDTINLKLSKSVSSQGQNVYTAYVVNKIIVKGNNKEIKTLRLRDDSGRPLWIKNFGQNNYNSNKTKK